MNRFFVLIAALLLVVVILSCQSDIVLPPETPLKGNYEGMYTYITNLGNTSSEVVRTAHVIFIFDETQYHMNLDTNYTGEECFCAVDGQYALTEGVRLKEEHSVAGGAGECGGSACNEELNPDGTFVRETKGDSLIMKYKPSSTTLQMLRLLKVSD